MNPIFATTGTPLVNFDDGRIKEYLSAYPHKWPDGLQNCFIKNLIKTPFRIFICDDSGSVIDND